MSIPDQDDGLIQRLSQHLDRRDLARLTVGGLGVVVALPSLADMADAADKKKRKKRKKKQKRRKHRKQGTTTPAPNTVPPTNYVFDREIGRAAARTPGVLLNPAGIATDSAGNVYVADNFKSRVVKFAPAGTSIKDLGTPGDGANDVGFPSAIALDAAGAISIANGHYDQNDDYVVQIQVLDANGDFSRNLANPAPDVLTDVHGLAVAANGHVYASDSSLGQVYEWDETGQFVAAHNPNSELQNPLGVAIDSNGHIAIADQDANAVWVYTLPGFATYATLNTPGGGAGEMNNPTALAFDSADNLYVSDQYGGRTQKFVWNSGTSTYDVAGSLQASGNAAVAIGAGGDIYIADDYVGKVQRFSSAFTLLNEWGPPGEGVFANVEGVAADSTGAIYVTDSGTELVHKFNSSGNVVTSWGGQGTAPGKFDFVEGIAVDAAGTIYVADWLNDRVQRFNANGNPAGSPWDLAVGPHELAVRQGITYVSNSDNESILALDSSGAVIAEFAAGLFDYDVEGIAISDTAIYLADGNNEQILRFDLNRQPLTPWSVPGAGGIATDAVGRVFVSSYDDDRIHVFDANGGELFAFGQSGQGAGELDGPRALAFDGAGNLLVTDRTDRVRRFTPAPGRAASKGGGKDTPGKGKHSGKRRKAERQRRGERAAHRRTRRD
ncbi:MAG: hypothetical protein QM692_04635 [Thermomicrobiales bacterium]